MVVTGMMDEIGWVWILGQREVVAMTGLESKVGWDRMGKGVSLIRGAGLGGYF